MKKIFKTLSAILLISVLSVSLIYIDKQKEKSTELGAFGTIELWKISSSLLSPIKSTWDIYAPSNLRFDGEIQPDGSTCADGEILKKIGANNWGCAVESGGGGTGNVATSTSETSGYVSYWTSTGATPATLGSNSNLQFDGTNLIVGGYASSTALWTSGNLHVGGASTFDGLLSGAGWDSSWATAYNATTTLNGFTPGDYLSISAFIATTTWSGNLSVDGLLGIGTTAGNNDISVLESVSGEDATILVSTTEYSGGTATATATTTPGTATDGGGGSVRGSWTSLSSGLASDNVYASNFDDYYDNELMNFFEATNLGFSIPTGSTITGIVASVEADEDGSDDFRDYSIRLIVGGSYVGTDKSTFAVWSTTDTFHYYGGDGDLWGVTPTVDQVNASDFGVAVQFQCQELGDCFAGTTKIDSVSIKIYYTPPVTAIDGYVNWTFGIDSTDDSFKIAPSDTLGVYDYFFIASTTGLLSTRSIDATGYASTTAGLFTLGDLRVIGSATSTNYWVGTGGTIRRNNQSNGDLFVSDTLEAGTWYGATWSWLLNYQAQTIQIGNVSGGGLKITNYNSTVRYFDIIGGNGADAGYVGIGDSSPAALFTVGSGDLFQVDSSGNMSTSGYASSTTSLNTQGTLHVGSTSTFDGNATTTGHFTITNGTNGVTIEPGATTTFRGF